MNVLYFLLQKVTIYSLVVENSFGLLIAIIGLLKFTQMLKFNCFIVFRNDKLLHKFLITAFQLLFYKLFSVFQNLERLGMHIFSGK